ncbi:hypothetical protein HD806DRAFT_550141 [Xylariaceae sp. AK1471]|nr:hypothetical protein HD806DRAFT_550141 [Xylariaceae sp. AK1471]
MSEPPSQFRGPHFDLLHQLILLGPPTISDAPPPSANIDTSSSTDSETASDTTLRPWIQKLVTAATILVGPIPTIPMSLANIHGIGTNSNVTTAMMPSSAPLLSYTRLLRRLAALRPPPTDQIPDCYMNSWVEVFTQWAQTICESLPEEEEGLTSGSTTSSSLSSGSGGFS